MRILTLNLWHGRKQAELRDFLLAQIDATDIFCFQEANGRQAEALLAELFDENDFQAARAEKIAEPAGHYYLTTIVKNKYALASSYELLDNDDKETGKAVVIEIGPDNERLKIINVHGLPRPGHKLDTEGRLRQSQQLLGAASGTRSIICGDFNLLPEAESIGMIAGAGYRNLISEYSVPTTRNRLAWELHPENKQLFADYAFTSPDVEVTYFAVPDIEVSDHLPMILEIA